MVLDPQLSERIKYAEMKARHKNLTQAWYRRWWGIVIIIILSIVLLFILWSALYVANKTMDILAQNNNVVSTSQRQTYLNEINGDGTNYYLGSKQAKIVIVEFGDFACPFCKKSSPIISKLVKEQADKIKLVWRDYLRNKDSIELALSARCAGEQNKFWEMHDLLFANQDQLSVNDSTRNDKLITLANQLELNTKQFTNCLNNKRYLDKIKKDYNDGNALKIVGTPSWFINNYPMAGALSEKQFRNLISGILK